MNTRKLLNGGRFLAPLLLFFVALLGSPHVALAQAPAPAPAAKSPAAAPVPTAAPQGPIHPIARPTPPQGPPTPVRSPMAPTHPPAGPGPEGSRASASAPGLTPGTASDKPMPPAGGKYRLLWQIVGFGFIVLVGFVLWRLLRQTGTTLFYLGGFALIFAGERLWPDTSAHWPLTILGLVAVLSTIAIRLRDRASTDDPTRGATEKQALIWSLVGLGSLLLYFLTTKTVVHALGLSDEAASRWTTSWEALFPIVWLLGTLPMLFVDRVLVEHPLVVPRRAGALAVQAGLSTALGISLLFPLNYLATNIKWEYDSAYFRTTAPGTATLAIVRGLPKPVTAYLFYPAGNDVKEQLLPYFEQLREASGGMLDVQVVDQALVPELAESLQVRENGYVALVQGDNTEKFRVGDDLDRARTQLKKLDGTVQKHLGALARGQRTLYMLTGHGEASPRERDDPLRKMNHFKQVMDVLNYKVKNFGVSEGSADAVPDDAAAVIIAAPKKPLLPEEVTALEKYIDRGGRLLIMIEPDGAHLDGLLGYIGLEAGDADLANDHVFIRQTRGVGDRVLLVTNRFGSHEAITTLSRNSTQLAVVVPTVTWLDRVPGGKGKVTTLIRSMPNTWADTEPNRVRDPGEPTKVWDLADAVSGGGQGDEQFRAIVIGDANVFSDPVLEYSQGNTLLAQDGMRWLVGDEADQGKTESEEDVRIQHTRDQDVAWFWSTIFAVPALILVGGIVFTRKRRKAA